MNGPSLLYDFVNKPSLDAVVGPRLSFTRATSASVRDYTGRIRYVPSGTPRFEGVDLRENLLVNSGLQGGTTPTGWSVTVGTGTREVAGATADSGTKIKFTATAERPFITSTAFSVKAGHTYVFSAIIDEIGEGSTLKLNDILTYTGTLTGASTSYMGGISSSTTLANAGIVAGSTLTFVLQAGTTDGSISMRFGIGVSANATGIITMSRPMVEEVSYTATTTTPGSWLYTGGSARYEYSGLPDDYTSRDSTVSTGLLLEEGRTNLCVQSQDISTTWTNGNTTDSVNQAVAPDGSLTADELIENTATSTHSLANTSAGSDPTTARCISVFVKAATGDRDLLLFLFNNSDTAQFLQVQGDVSAGTVTSQASGPDSSVTATGMEDYGNGWYRLWISGIVDSLGAGVNTLQAQVRLVSSGSSSYTGDGASGLYLWGFQVEAGSFPSSYIPTTTATVTRNVENISATLSGEVNFKGTIYAHFDKFHTYTGLPYPRVFNFWKGTAPRIDSSLVAYTAGTTFECWDTSAVLSCSLGDANEIAIRVNDNDLAAYSDASNATDSIGVTSTDTPTTLFVGQSSAGAGTLDGHIKKLAYWKDLIPNSELSKFIDGSRPVTITGMPYEDFMRRKRMMLARR